MKSIIFSILVGLLIVSCRPENIDIEVEAASPKLVVFSHLIPDNAMIIAVSRSFSALQPSDSTSIEDLLVSGAQVSVTTDEGKIDLFEFSPGLYTSLSTPNTPGKVYDLLVIKDSDTISATSKMLQKVDFTEITPVITKGAVDTTIYLNIKIVDNPLEKNWYAINVYQKKESLPSGSIDPVNFFENGSNSLASTTLVSDAEFSGTYEKSILIENVAADDSVVVTLSNISEKYYNYLTLRGKSGSFFQSLNLEPVNYPTNVVNGYGFFNTHAPDIRFFDLGEF
jgi:hypothetical protein